MGKRFLLSAIAVSVIAGSAYAGKLKGSDDINVSKEWVLQNKLNKGDANVTLNTDKLKKYEPTNIPAGTLSNPTLNITFSGVKAVDLNETDNLGICESGKSSNTSVLEYDHIDKANNKIVFKAIKADNTMGNSKIYFICNTDTNKTDGKYGFKLKLDPDAEKVGIKFQLYSGDSQEIQDESNELSTVNRVEQLCAKVATPANAKIDPATGFVAFGQNTTTTSSGCNTSTTTNTQKTDKIIISFYDNKSKIGKAKYEVKNYAILANVTASNALPIDKKNTTYTVTKGTQKDLVIDDNKIFKMAATGIDYTSTPKKNDENNMTLTIAVDGNTPLSETTFSADIGFNLKNETDSFTKGYSSTEDAGKWVYKGTKVDIPYVVSNGDTRTVIRLTNGQSVNANVYWTCTDDNGVTVANIQVPAATMPNGEKYVPANGAAAWLTKDILAAAQAKNPDFAPNGKMKCSPLVTATAGVKGVVIMTINGGRDRVIPVTTQVQE